MPLISRIAYMYVRNANLLSHLSAGHKGKGYLLTNLFIAVSQDRGFTSVYSECIEHNTIRQRIDCVTGVKDRNLLEFEL